MWVAAWDTSRIGRRLFVHQQFLGELYLRGASLYIASPARQVANGSSDGQLERMLVMAHHEERARMVERMRLGHERKRGGRDSSA